MDASRESAGFESTARSEPPSGADATLPPVEHARASRANGPAVDALGLLSLLRGVGPARAATLARAGVHDLASLLALVPTRIEEGLATRTIGEVLATRGLEVQVEGKVLRTSLMRFGKRSTVRVTLDDGTGSIAALFFNQPWLRKRFEVGRTFALRGRVTESKGPAFVSPRVGSSDDPLPVKGDVRPLYPAIDGVSQTQLATWCREALAVCGDRLSDAFEELVPQRELASLALPSLARAVQELHEPASRERFEAARARMALERLLELQARLEARRRNTRAGRALPVVVHDDVEAGLKALFPYSFTAAQGRVARELRTDLARTQPMRRLLQGDVGSGKTALGVYACLLVARAGGQSAFLAPTELLAEQHSAGLRRLCASAGLHTEFLSGSATAAERRRVLALLANGDCDVVFGTHALFSADVHYRRLALAVIDEQHRFGVAQRAALIVKGRAVHALLMTATPIPRTLALALYGDLDTSVLDERPPGRGLVHTRWVRGVERRKVEQFLCTKVAAGERLYWVVPRIGDGDDELADAGGTKAETAEARHQRLLASPLAQHGVELVHGRMDGLERARRLERFRRGDVRTLVATTVIEVGVDVPEASLMVIEGAERLGLAQLHQLRGRVGRGARESWCLMYGDKSAHDRLRLLEETSDGFRIAEEDLAQRGMGDLLGVRQAGVGFAGDELDHVALFHAAQRLVSENEALYVRYAARQRDEVIAHTP